MNGKKRKGGRKGAESGTHLSQSLPTEKEIKGKERSMRLREGLCREKGLKSGNGWYKAP